MVRNIGEVLGYRLEGLELKMQGPGVCGVPACVCVYIYIYIDM